MLGREATFTARARCARVCSCGFRMRQVLVLSEDLQGISRLLLSLLRVSDIGIGSALGLEVAKSVGLEFFKLSNRVLYSSNKSLVGMCEM